MLANPSLFEGFRDHGELAARVAELGNRTQPSNICVGLRLEGHTTFACADEAGSTRTLEAAQSPLIRAGCLAKPITATLLADAMAARHLDWSTPLLEVVRVTGAAKSSLARVTVAHLLNHTHGLDASLIRAVPRTSDGLVDAAALCDQLCAQPLSEPGYCYSYSNVGAWIAAAVVERLRGQAFAQCLSQSGLTDIEGSPERLSCGAVCPATGDTLELTAAQWLSFLELHLQAGKASDCSPDPGQSLASLQARLVPLPGWSPAEQAAGIGWKYYGEGWFGHNANLTTSSALLRFNPRGGIAIVLSAGADAAFSALAGLFGAALPELINLKIPRFLNPAERGAVRLERYVGSYAHASQRIEVAAAPKGGLSLQLQAQKGGLPASPLRFRPAQQNVFFCESTSMPELAFIQFLPLKRLDLFDYLWNGKQLWRRV